VIVEASITIGCDHNGCNDTYEVDTADARYARAAASNAGWVHRLKTSTGFSRSVDYCPRHRDDHDHETVEAR
jgi:hypothetical protein